MFDLFTLVIDPFLLGLLHFFFYLFVHLSVLYFPVGVFICGFSGLLVSHMFRMSSVVHGWVLGRLKPIMSVATSVITSLKLLVMTSTSPNLLAVVEDPICPVFSPQTGWKCLDL